MEALQQRVGAISVLSSAPMEKLFQTKMGNAQLLPESALTAILRLQPVVMQLVQMAPNLEPQDVLMLYKNAKTDLHQPPTVVPKNAQEV